MQKRRILSAVTAFAMLASAFTAMPVSAAATRVTLNPSDASPFNGGRFEGWGTSLCWWANRLGYSDKLTEAAADAFFSDDGLRLNIARYNLGGGDNPTHNHITRSDSKVPGVWKTFELSADGKDVDITEYDITKDQNQLNIAKAALEANPDLYFEGFSNSAPYFMTVSGCTSGADPASSDNLKADMYDDFGRFIAEATLLFKEEGIEFQSYSPMNEPDTAYWGVNSPKQEGCHFNPGESQSKAIVETRKALDEKGLNNVLVAGMDETSIDSSVSNLGKLSSEAQKSLGRIDTHTYGGSKRAQLKAKAQQMNKTLWMSEVDKGGDGATLASMIITDMNGMQPAAWVMWDIIDLHKDSSFTAPDGSHSEANASLAYTGSVWGVGMANHDDETLFLSNKYYAFGQFTRYINPGDTIITSSANTLAAYNKDTGDIKIVANNAGNASDVEYEFDLSAFRNVGGTVKTIRSDLAGNEKWATIENGAVLDGKTLSTTLKANTITTYVIETGNAPAEVEGDVVIKSVEITSNGLNYSYEVADNLKNYDTYFAVYDKNGKLVGVTKNKSDGSVKGAAEGCGFRLFVWDGMTPKSAVADEAVSGTAEYAIISGSSVGVGTEIKRGSKIQLSLNTNITGGVSWSVDDENTAEISADGLLDAKKRGAVTVTASVGDYSVSKTYDIVVYASIVGKNTVIVGSTANMVLNTNAEETPVWSVDDESVATISENGVLTALKEGDVTVTAKLGEYLTATKTVKAALYTLSGTPSWGNSSTLPSDSADYRKAADGNLNTFFDGVSGGYVMYDYGSPFKINSVKLAARSGSGMAARTVGAKIQGSNDAVSWTDLYTITSAIAAGSYTTLTADNLSNNSAYRYFRYTNSQEMANIAEFLIDASPSNDIADGEPTVRDIDGFTDDFDGSTNIFGAEASGLTADNNAIYASGLERFTNVFLPIKSTAQAELADAIELGANERFRIKFNVFSGWEEGGANNEFSINNADGDELVGFTVSGGGYNLNQMRIGGVDLLDGVSNKPVFQSITSATKGANGWEHSSQPYVNNMGANKTVEIIIDGTGKVTAELSGGAASVSYDGTLNMPISVKSLVLTGDYNIARGRVVSYDNFDADVITYSAPLPTPVPTPAPTEAPEIPENGELINLSFDGDLSSSSPYGKASGSPKIVEVDGKKCAQFDGTAATVITLNDANGNSLLAGIDEFTVSFKIKPTTTGTSWWFFAAPNDSSTGDNPTYLGCLTKNNTAEIERFKSGRPVLYSRECKANEWSEVIISFKNDATTTYINGEKTEQASTYGISDILGDKPVLYIGKATWGTGEYATGYLDDFVITEGAADIPAVTLGDLSAVTADITLPQTADDSTAVAWTSSDTSVIANDGKVTRPDETTKVTLTATMTKDGETYTQTFTANVIGYFAAADAFVAYAEDGKIKYGSDYDLTGPKNYSAQIMLTVPLEDGTGDQVLEVKDTLNDSFSYTPQNGTYTVEMHILEPRTGTPLEKKTVFRTVQVKAEQEMGAYLFAHFVGRESTDTDEQVYLSVSKDAKSWTVLNGGNPVLTSSVGEKGVRDPYIIRGEDGKFFIIATDLSIYNRRGDSNRWGTCQTSGSQSVVIWESADLVNWSEARLVKVAPDNAGCTWAPEAVYDPEEGKYMVFWASKVATDNYSTQRVYRSYTSDFVNFSTPEVYIDGGTVSNIDTTIINHKGMYYRFTKNESKSTITMMKCPTLNGKWENVDTYNLGNKTGYEGPTCFKINGTEKWCLLFDLFSQSKGYYPFITNDISKGSFTEENELTTNPQKMLRHGTVMPITTAEYDKLVAAYAAD